MKSCMGRAWQCLTYNVHVSKQRLLLFSFIACLLYGNTTGAVTFIVLLSMPATSRDDVMFARQS